MKKGIHPSYVQAKVTCACGNSFETRSTVPEIKLDICSGCHPFFTGRQKIVDTEGRVQKFLQKYGKHQQKPSRESNLRVDLISHTLDPERTVAAAVRLCYSASDLDKIRQRIDDAEAARLVGMALKLGHHSVLEHASFTFGIEGISRACSHQLVRHRMASFSQQSQRYVKMRDCDFTTPKSISNRPEIAEKYRLAVEHVQAVYDELLDAGLPAEDARYILPNAAETKVLMTANARSLLNFFELRLCVRAQWEIRLLAESMLELVKPIAPNIFSVAGPTCDAQGFCREGDKSCGKCATRNA